MWEWNKYVPVAERRAKASRQMEKLSKKGQKIEPIEISGNKIAKEFWGQKWCDYVENFADYDNRLPRGRTYVRNGSVCHLAIEKGQCEAIVSGSELYKVKVTVKGLKAAKWQAIKTRCQGKVSSLLELLQGKLSKSVMELVADHKEGLFPLANEIDFECSCPDWADMCKHVAAVLYGIAHRLDRQPELLFVLRGVEASELVSTQLVLEAAGAEELAGEDLSSLFGIEIDTAELAPVASSVIITPVDKELAKAEVDFDHITGSQLQALRQATGLSIAVLANRLGISAASIHRWEKQPNELHLHSSSRHILQQFFTKK